MQVSIQPTNEALVSVMTVSVPNSGVGERVARRLKEIQKTMRMDGFRPGKVPMNLVQQRYHGQTQAESIEDAVYNAFNQAVKAKQVAIAGLLGIENVDFKDDTISFSARYDVFPEISLPDLSSISVEKSVVEISDADVDAMIEKLREMRKVFSVVEEAAQDGDMVNIDFVGSLNGEKFDGGSAENVPLVLGSGRMIPGFEAGIIGMKAGETKTIDVTFPEAYQAAHLAGKETQFDITVNSVQRASLPEVDAEFMSAFGIEDGNVDAFKEDVRKNLARQVNLSLMRENREFVLDALTSAVTFDVPKSLVFHEVESMLKEMHERGQGKPSSEVVEQMKATAGERVSMGLLMAEIIKKHNLTPSEDKVKELLALEADGYDEPEQFIQWYLNDKQRRQQVEGLALEHAIVELVFAQAKVTPVTKSLDSLAG
jgi:trigger factor